LPNGLVLWAGVGVLAVATGFAESRSPGLAAATVIAFLVAVGAAIGGLEFVAVGSVAALPWLVVFSDLLPPLLKTFTSAAAMLALCAYVRPLKSRNSWLPWAVFVFLLATLYGVANSSGSTGLTVGAKYFVFPIMALAVTSTNARERLPRLLKPVLISSGLAMVAQLGIIVLGLGAIGTYYSAGEHLGFDKLDPLELALMCVIVATGGLIAGRSARTKLLFLGLGLIPALETADRTAAVASALVILAFIASSGFRFSYLAAVAVVAAVIVGAGVLGAIESRVTSNLQTGQFSSFQTAGSGRGAIWTADLTHFIHSGASGIVFGTGIGSVENFTKLSLGTAFDAHSDVVEIGVQLGLVGFAAWIIIWLVLLSDAGLSRIVLIPIAVYALITGSIEATAPVTLGLFFAAAAPAVSLSETLPARLSRQPRPMQSSPAYP
jgi:hypothetical protein